MVTTCLHIRSTPNYKDYYKGQGHKFAKVPLCDLLYMRTKYL